MQFTQTLVRPGVSWRIGRLAAVLATAVTAMSAPSDAHAGQEPVDPSILDGSAQLALDQARIRWAGEGLSSYRFRVSLECFCLPEVRRPRVITVRRGKPRHPPAHLREVATVPRLFRLIQNAIDERYSGLGVRYGGRGLPREISTDGRRSVADDEATYHASRLRPLTP